MDVGRTVAIYKIKRIALSRPVWTDRPHVIAGRGWPVHKYKTVIRVVRIVVCACVHVARKRAVYHSAYTTAGKNAVTARKGVVSYL